jgi:hypothetical protein
MKYPINGNKNIEEYWIKTREKSDKITKKLINPPGYHKMSGGINDMNKTDMECLSALQHDHLYMQQNYEKLRKKYIDEFVAIRNKKIIASNKDLESLLRFLRSKKINPACTLIEFFPPKDLLLVL